MSKIQNVFLLEVRFGCGFSTKIKTAAIERIMCATVVTLQKNVGKGKSVLGDMHVLIIEIKLHNITRYYTKSSVYFHLTANVCKSFPCGQSKSKKEKIQASILTKKGFHSLTFVLDHCRWPSFLSVSWMTNFTKCTTRSCLSMGYFFRAAKETFTQHNIEYGLPENFSFNFKFNVPDEWAFDGIEIS